ncbi:MAG: hypothetical protein HY853_00120 [Burkholderiales bacterium]|nr:hypothetical protein [Burkholderiales bacterium]
MEQNLKPGGSDDSLTPSTRLLNQKLGTSPAPRRLTPSEIELLLQSKRELAEQAFATPTRASTHKVAAAA